MIDIEKYLELETEIGKRLEVIVELFSNVHNYPKYRIDDFYIEDDKIVIEVTDKPDSSNYETSENLVWDKDIINKPLDEIEQYWLDIIEKRRLETEERKRLDEEKRKENIRKSELKLYKKLKQKYEQ